MQKNRTEMQFPATSIRTWLAWAGAAFDDAGLYFGHGTDNAVDDAAFLISYALKTDFDFRGFDPDAPLSDDQNRLIRQLLEKRIATRKPAAYLVGEAWFAGQPYFVDEHVLVPRSPLAELIMDEFQPWIDQRKVQSIIDIGTGSGCIGIACALALPWCNVDLVDIDDNALNIANKNIRRHKLEQRVSVIQSDVFDSVPARLYDIIISNPPYVSQSEYESLPTEYHREPRLGLESGDDGLHCVRKILALADRYLSDHGILVVEVGNTQAALEAAYPNVAFTWLEFEYGGSGVFLLEKRQLLEYKQIFLTSLNITG